ncbi:MAG TPA: type I secretion system permease/ATPase [Alcaligenaceae bacterium]|nr:type I secretion system permease/ATPase [Alcaligenaceae bacterium]
MVETSTSFSDSVPHYAMHDDSLLSCLVEVTRLHGYPSSGQHLIAGLPLKNHRLSADLLSRAAARGRCTSKLVRRSLKNLPNEILPAILFLQEDRHCVLIDIDVVDGVATATVHYPESPVPVKVTLEKLQQSYAGVMAFVKPHYQVEQRAKDGQAKDRSKNWFWAAVFDNWRLYRDALAAAFLINVLALVMPLFTLNVYDRVVPNKAIETLWVLVIGVVLALLFNWILTTTRARVVDRASSKVDVRLSAQIMEQVLGIKMEGRPASVGAFAANLRSFESVRDFIASASLTTLVDLPFMFLFIAVLGWISPYMMIPPLIAMLVIVVVSLFAQRRLESLSKQSFQASSQRNAVLVESLSGLETIKVLNAQGMAQRQWEQATEQIAVLNAKIKSTTSATVSFVQTAQQLVTVSVVVIGVFLVQEAQLSMGGIIASSMIAGRSLAPLGPLAGLMMQFHNARNSLGSIDNYMKLPVEHNPETQYLPRPVLRGKVEFRDVSFAYPNTEHNILKNISFTLEEGEKVGIIGRIGSGKTTLAKLILGLYQPSSGTILVDDVDSQQVDPADLRRAMGYVSQDPVLFYGTLKHNLTMGAPFATDEQMLEVAKMTGVDRFASKHPDGYSMMISERGESLSGGQRQAIAVARSLLGNPSVLLLDEPSSNMDNQSEVQLRKHLKPICAPRTVVLITHRMALLELVDRLMVVDNGKIVADGPKDQVIAALREGRIEQRGH